MKHIKGVQELTADKLSRININDIIPKMFETDKIFNLYDDNVSGAFNQVPINKSIQKRLSSTMTKNGKKATPIAPDKINPGPRLQINRQATRGGQNSTLAHLVLQCLIESISKG